MKNILTDIWNCSFCTQSNCKMPSVHVEHITRFTT